MFAITDTEFGLMLANKRNANEIARAQGIVDRMDAELAAAYRAIRTIEAMLETERGLRLAAEDKLDRILKLPISRLN